MATFKNEDFSEKRRKFKKLTLIGIKSLPYELGRGAYGRVYQVKYHGVLYAAKEIHTVLLHADSSRLRENFEQECIRCSELTHPNIVRFLGIYYPNRGSPPVMIMELMDESLTKYVEKSNISLKRKISILHDVAEGLSYLHSRNPPVIHRDLSPNNVLLKSMSLLPVAKIADLGVAKVVQADSTSTKSHLTKVPGTVDFMPPEALVDNPKYGLSLDVFSYGGIMLHTINQEWPTPKAQAEFDPLTRYTKGLNEVERRKDYLDKMVEEAELLKPLVESCLDNDPSMRPSIAHLSEKIKPLKELPHLVPALQNGYEITWEKCADLPSPMYNSSAVLHDEKVYIIAGGAPDYETYEHVYCYNITTDQWEQLPSPGHHLGVLQVIKDKLAVIGGADNITNMRTNKVSTYINNSWTDYYPNLLKARSQPGVVSYLQYVIVAGGAKDACTFYDDIELLDSTQPSQWIMSNVLLPEPMWGIYPCICDTMFCVVGYSGSWGRCTTSCQIAADIIITSTVQQSINDQEPQWIDLPNAPHYNTASTLVSHPPVIVGGRDHEGVPTSGISMLDDSGCTWKRVASLSSPRNCVAVVVINYDTIMVFGGCTGGKDITESKAHSITTVEKGKAGLAQAMAAIPVPTEDTQCCIQ